MPTDVALKHNTMDQLTARRLPNLEFLVASNTQPAGALHIPVAQRRTIVTLERSNCRWPIGDPQHQDFYLCGAHTTADESYCTHHKQLAHVPDQKSRRAA